MSIFNAIALIGGLALFLYGMNLLGEGLSKTSGGKLESILEKLTSNPIKGVLLGAGVTAVIQSSSATTVMVVGFVNSGIMNSYIMAVKSYRNTRGQFFYKNVETNVIFSDSCNYRCYYDYVL